MKKIVSLSLVLIMVFTIMLPLTVGAEDNNPFRLERTATTYPTLTAAVNDAQDGDTITLLRDYDMKDESNKYYVQKAVTIDGGNHKITNTATTSYLWFFAAPEGKEVTLKNVELESKGGFRVCATGQTVVMENVTATIKYDLFMNLQITGGFGTADKNTTVTFKNSTITHDGVTPAIATYSNSSFTVNLQNSTIKKGLNSAINTVNKNDLSYSTICATTGQNVTVNVDGTSVISASRIKADGKTITCFSTDASASVNMTVNLAKGAQLRLDDVNSNTCQFFAAFRNGAAPTVVDNGAKWIISKEVAKTGIAVPENVKYSEDATVLGWTVDGNLIESSTYQNEEATNDIELSVITFDNSNFQLQVGASIRTSDPYGIRFTAQISTELYEMLKEIDPDLEVGMIIAPTAKVFGGFNVNEMLERDYVKVANTQWTTEDKDGFNVFRVAMYGIPVTKDGFKTQLSAMAYFTIHFADGSTQTIYTVYDKGNNSRSLYDVAKAAYDAGMTDNTIINNIILTVDG